MKPVKLIISGWGPYKDVEKIDFETVSKRGIFLITGQTGAGKTTIFDAITYALYGDLSGSLRQKATVRSDFADAQTQTYVEFTMTHNGKRYRIRRNPEYQRPRKRKGGKESFVTEKENAVLEFEDGRVLEGNREVNEKILKILRLDLKQFRQISMIAQGEFAQLLHAGGDEKMRIFREIFGTGIYDAFLKKLKERTSSAEKMATEYLHRLEENVRLFSSEDPRYLALTAEAPYPYREIRNLLFEMGQEAEAKAKQLEESRNETEKQIRQANAQLVLAERINESFRQYERQKERHGKLLDKKPMMDRLRKECELAEAAGKLAETKQQLTVAEEDLVRQQKLLTEQTQKVDDLCKLLEDFAPAACREQELELFFEVSEQEKKMAVETAAAYQMLEKYEQQLAEKQQRYLKAEQEMLCCQKVCEQLKQARRYSMIGLVAELVREGEPCPVCGSVEHPKLAVSQDGPNEEQIKTASEKLEEARNVQMKCHGAARAALELREKQKKEAEALDVQYQKIQEETVRQKEALSKVLTLLGTEAGAAEFRKKMRWFHENQASVLEKKKNIVRLGENISLLTARQKALEEQLTQQKRQQGFLEDDSWEKWILTEDVLIKKRKELSGYQEEMSACTELLGHLKEELTGKQVTDTQQLKEELEGLQKDSAKLLEQLQKSRLQSEACGRTGRALDENLKKSQDAQAVYGVAKDLENMASGNNAKRLVFEQYVLAGYFDDILRAANLRLKYMSSGRYELFRGEKVSDGRKKDSLEMEVMDYYTGKKRGVRTLSGGETFKASLALALGLSDAVCAACGGVKVDTMFIDEGFGALDAQSLDQACTTLISLSGQDRLIGIISHVSELAERIPDQIRVKKETLGSSVCVKF